MPDRKEGPFVKRLSEAFNLYQRELRRGIFVPITPVCMTTGLNPDKTDCEVGKLILERSHIGEIVLRAIPSMKFAGCIGEGEKTLSALMTNLEIPTWALLMGEFSDWNLEVLDAFNAFEADLIEKTLLKKKYKFDSRAVKMLCVIRPELAGKL